MKIKKFKIPIKPIIIFFLLLQTSVFAPSNIPKITCDLISFEPCKNNKISAVLRINILEKDATNTELLKAQQTIDIPCVKPSKISFSKFKKSTRLEKIEQPLLSVLDYLKQNDKDGSIFEIISQEIEKN